MNKRLSEILRLGGLLVREVVKSAEGDKRGLNLVIAGSAQQFQHWLKMERNAAIERGEKFDANRWRYVNKPVDLIGYGEDRGDVLHFWGEFWKNPIYQDMHNLSGRFPNWINRLPSNF